MDRVEKSIEIKASPTLKKRYLGKKIILGIIGISIVLILIVPGGLFDIIYELVYPVSSITNVSVVFIGGSNPIYQAYFRLLNSIGGSVASDGTVYIRITQNNNILYEKSFTVYKSQFGIGEVLGGRFWYYKWTFPASDVLGLPSVLPDLVSDLPKNVTATITFTTPRGKKLTGTDDVYEPY